MSYRKVRAQTMQAGLKKQPSRESGAVRQAWELVRPENPDFLFSAASVLPGNVFSQGACKAW